MHTRIKPTATVYPCRYRAQSVDVKGDASCVWVTWEVIEREHFRPDGSLVADFSQPREVDPAQVKNHRYIPEP
ncbi:hypothetical protein [Dyella sp. 2HG41-7]|uniref:hypothetical protein n=1 Tax=Dyella sp. 2HG41-7 TaxID=2883239 RepID=UPI001F3DE3E4|nr:hypothetical protein [Dyella sp. 2HG41-7]